jgi:hypothetical protein
LTALDFLCVSGIVGLGLGGFHANGVQRLAHELDLCRDLAALELRHS